MNYVQGADFVYGIDQGAGDVSFHATFWERSKGGAPTWDLAGSIEISGKRWPVASSRNQIQGLARRFFTKGVKHSIPPRWFPLFQREVQRLSRWKVNPKRSAS
jgi:hypothetical protein